MKNKLILLTGLTAIAGTAMAATTLTVTITNHTLNGYTLTPTVVNNNICAPTNTDKIDVPAGTATEPGTVTFTTTFDNKSGACTYNDGSQILGVSAMNATTGATALPYSTRSPSIMFFTHTSGQDYPYNPGNFSSEFKDKSGIVVYTGMPNQSKTNASQTWQILKNDTLNRALYLK